MAVYDLEEQDQLEDLRAWWKQWGNTVAGIVIALAVGVIGVQGWRWWSQHQAEQAAVLYDALSTAARANDAPKAKDAMTQLADKYGGTGYASRGALLLAAVLFDSGDIAGAKAQLTFVIDKSSEDELKAVARLRLAALLFDEKQYDEALRVLDARRDDAFAGMYADSRGDVLAAAGRIDEARTAYQTALTQLDPKSAYRNFVQVKLDALPAAVAAAGGAATPFAPPAAPVAGAGAPAAAPPAAANSAAASSAPTPPAPAATAPASTPTPAPAAPSPATGSGTTPAQPAASPTK